MRPSCWRVFARTHRNLGSTSTPCRRQPGQQRGTAGTDPLLATLRLARHLSCLRICSSGRNRSEADRHPLRISPTRITLANNGRLCDAPPLQRPPRRAGGSPPLAGRRVKTPHRCGRLAPVSSRIPATPRVARSFGTALGCDPPDQRRRAAFNSPAGRRCLGLLDRISYRRGPAPQEWFSQG